MTNPVHAIQGVNPQAETQQTSALPKTQQATTQNATPQDKVTISQEAQQALTNNNKPA